MPAEKLDQFGGMLPAWHPNLLPNGQAALSINGYLFSGALGGWRQPKLLRALQNTAARFVYRIPIVSETQAIAYLVFVAQPQQGDTFTIGELTYTWVNALPPIMDAGTIINGSPYQIQIGATTAASAVNALAAITADNNSNANMGVLYGQNTTSNNDVLFYPTGIVPTDGLPAPTTGTVNIAGTNYAFVEIGATDFGSAFNTIPVGESTGGARTVFLKDLLSLSDTTTTYAGGTNPILSQGITGASTWLEFLDQDTSVVRSQVVNDQFNRYYFTSPSQQPTYNTYARIVAGQPAWLLGVPAPKCSPSVAVTGGGDTLQLGTPNGTGTSTALNGNFVYLVPINPSGQTQIQDVQVQPQSTDVNCNVAALIYEDSNGVPGQLLNTGNIVTGITAGTNITSSFQNPSNLLANTQYWIGFMTDTAENWSAAQGANLASFANTFSNGPPGEAPNTLVTGGNNVLMFADLIISSVVEARSYVYSYVSEYDEEGPISPATLVDGWSNGVWTISDIFPPVADDMGVLRNLKYVNLYRTVVGSAGGTVFFYVCTLRLSDWAFSLQGISGPFYGGNLGLGSPSVTVDGNAISGLASGTESFTDTLPDNYVSLNNQLASVNWFQPPPDLQGVITMPNGVMVGFKNNEIWFSQPYQPHAWPPGYALTTEYPIIGLGLANNALVVCTSTVPYVINGVSPGNMTSVKCSIPTPCISRGSILSGEQSVTYMSPNGLIQVSAQGVISNTTDLWFTREKWQQLTPQKFARAIYLASCYFCFGTTAPLGQPTDNSVAQQGFTIELDQDNQSFTIWPQPGGHRLGFNELSSHVLDANGNPFNIDNVEIDPWTGVGLLVSNGGVYYYDFSDPAPAMVPYTWTSKVYQQNNKKNYEAMKVFFTVPINTPPQNPARVEAPAVDPIWNTLQVSQYGIIKTFADFDGTGNMVLIDVREIRRSGELLRIISGFKAEQWQWQILGRVLISNIQVATSAKELANV